MKKREETKIGYADHEYHSEMPDGYLYGDRIRAVTGQLSETFATVIPGEIKPVRWDCTSEFTQRKLDRLDAGDILITHVPPMEIELPGPEISENVRAPLDDILQALGDYGTSIYANSLIQLYPLWKAGIKIIAYSGAIEDSLRDFEKTGFFAPGAVIAKTQDLKKDLNLIMTVVDRLKE